MPRRHGQKGDKVEEEKKKKEEEEARRPDKNQQPLRITD